MLVFWLIVACAAQVARTGLISPQGQRVELLDKAGKSTRLVLEGEARAVARMTGCVVDIRGTRVAGGIRVSGWEVRDAGFGSQPFVGRIRATPTGWVLDDRTTGNPLRLRDVAGGDPIPGSLVLINGFIVGHQELALISVRTLLEPGEDEADKRKR